MRDTRLIGRRLLDKYEVMALLGEGGFGAVYEVIQHPIRRRVAVKVIAPDKVRDREIRARFLAEAQAVAALSHPSIVTLIDFGVDPEGEGEVFMVLEYIDGEELGAILRRTGAMDPERVVRLGRQALAGLAEAHRAVLVHRDLKPANMIVVRDTLGEEQLKLLDFGIAKLLDSPDAVRTRSGVVLGTPAYMSPEQVRAKNIGPWSDQYSLGAVLFHMISGRPPFDGHFGLDLLLQHFQAPVPTFAPHRPIPTALAEVVRRALSKTPSERFESVAEMAQAMTSSLHAPDTSPASAPAMSDRHARRPTSNPPSSAPSVLTDRPAMIALNPARPPNDRGAFEIACREFLAMHHEAGDPALAWELLQRAAVCQEQLGLLDDTLATYAGTTSLGTLVFPEPAPEVAPEPDVAQAPEPEPAPAMETAPVGTSDATWPWVVGGSVVAPAAAAVVIWLVVSGDDPEAQQTLHFRFVQ